MLAVISLALVLVAGGVIGGIVSTSGGPPTPGAGVAPANFVVLSTQTTLNQHTADVDISGTVTAARPNHTDARNRDGGLRHQRLRCRHLRWRGANSFGGARARRRRSVYIGLTADGTNVSTVTGGPEWINVPLADQNSSSLGAGNVDPLDQLKLLEQKGATVVPLGTSSVDGMTVSGYAVTFSAGRDPAERSNKEIQALELPPARHSKPSARPRHSGRRHCTCTSTAADCCAKNRCRSEAARARSAARCR